jgi:hypothetical protein
VWGVLKYHHPAVTGGYAPIGKLRVVPRAPEGALIGPNNQNRRAGDPVNLRVARSQLGTPPVCDRCAAPKTEEKKDTSPAQPENGSDSSWAPGSCQTGFVAFIRGRIHEGRQFYVWQAPRASATPTIRKKSRAGVRRADLPRIRAINFWASIASGTSSSTGIPIVNQKSTETGMRRSPSFIPTDGTRAKNKDAVSARDLGAHCQSHR